MSTQSDINHLYQTILQRDADPDGLAYWSNQYAQGMPLAQIETSLIQSPEAQNWVCPVIEMYQTAFGRQADAGGLAYWVHQLELGVKMDAIAAGFAASNEAQATFGGSIVSEQFVEAVYANALGRAASNWEVGYWMTQGMTQSMVLISINSSAEAQGRYGDHPDAMLHALANDGATGGPLVDDMPVLNLHPSDGHYTGSVSGNTTFMAMPVNGANSLNNSSVIVGTSDGNVLDIQPIASGMHAAPTMSGVQTVIFDGPANAGSDNPVVLDLVHTTGLNEVYVRNGGGSTFEVMNSAGTGINISEASIVNSPAGTNGNTYLTLEGDVASALTLEVSHSPQGNGNFVQVSVTGLSESQGIHDLTLNLTSSSGATAASPDHLDLDVSGGPALHSMTINATGNESVDFAPFYVSGMNDAAAVTDVVVQDRDPSKPGGSLDLTDQGLNYFTGLQTFDSTHYTGDLHMAVGGDAPLVSIATGSGADLVDLSQHNAYNGTFTVNLGAGDDMLLLGANALGKVSYDGGEGHNVLGITDGAALVGTESFINFAVLEIGPSANPEVDNAAGLAGGTGVYDMSLLPGVPVHITQVDASPVLSGDVTFDKAGDGFSLDLVSLGATEISDTGEGELTPVAFADGGHMITLNMAAATDSAILKLDAGAYAYYEEGETTTPETVVAPIVATNIDTHNIGVLTIDSTWHDAGGPLAGQAAPGAEDANQIGLVFTDLTDVAAPIASTMTELDIVAGSATESGLSLLVDQGLEADQAWHAAPALATIMVSGVGTDVDLAYNASVATAAETGGVVLPDVTQGIQAPLTLVDASQLKGVWTPGETGPTGSWAGGNFHAILTDTASTPMTFSGAEQSNLVAFHAATADLDITGGLSDDYFSVDGAGSHVFHFTSGLVNGGAAPEAAETGETGETGSGHNGGGSGGGGEAGETGEAGTLLSDFANSANPGSVSVPNPAEIAESKMETIIGFNDANDTLDFSGLVNFNPTLQAAAVAHALTVGAIATAQLPFSTDADVAMAGFFADNHATNGVVVVSDQAKDASVKDLFVFVDADGNGSFDPLLDPVIHLHNDAGMTAASVANDIHIA